jgi:hypothetical protein
MIGRRFVRNILESFTYICAGAAFTVLTGVDIIFSWNFLILILFIPVTFSINHFFGIIIGSFGFFLKDSREFTAIAGTYLTFRNILSGLILPLDKAPFSGFFILTSYTWVLHHQVQIYLRNYNTNQTILAFLGGLAWSVVLYFLAKLVF